MGQLDWANTRAFIMPPEINIGVRINVKGWEKPGIVESGLEFETLCRHIMDGFYSFVDADTGQPLVKNLYMARDER